MVTKACADVRLAELHVHPTRSDAADSGHREAEGGCVCVCVGGGMSPLTGAEVAQGFPPCHGGCAHQTDVSEAYIPLLRTPDFVCQIARLHASAGPDTAGQAQTINDAIAPLTRQRRDMIHII